MIHDILYKLIFQMSYINFLAIFFDCNNIVEMTTGTINNDIVFFNFLKKNFNQ